MAKQCNLVECNVNARGFCYICEKNYCRKHFDEHEHSLNILLNQLNEKIQDLDDRLDQLNDEESIEYCYESVDQWREQSYQRIDLFYKKICQQIQNRFQLNVKNKQEKINDLQAKINKLLDEENLSSKQINSFKVDLQNVDKEMKEFEETRFHIDIKPLILEQNSVSIEERNPYQFSLKQLSNPFHQIHLNPNLFKPLSSNNTYLLTYKSKCLCLIDKQLNLIKEIPWKYSRVWDISYSTILNRFILITNCKVYLFDDQTMFIEHIKTIPRSNWWSTTSSNTHLYLSTYQYGSSIFQFDLKPSIKLCQQWKSPLTCSKEEFVKDIQTNDQTIALTLFNKNNLTKQIQLKSLINFELIWSLSLDLDGISSNTLRCSSLNSNQWLIADFDHQRLFQINDQGKIQKIYKYFDSPWDIHLFNQNILVISTPSSINFHQL